MFEIIKPFDDKATIIRRQRADVEVEKILNELEKTNDQRDHK